MRIFPLLCVISMPLCGATFYPFATQANVNAALLTANTNGTDDIIDLSNQNISLTVVEPGASTNALRPILSDGNHTLTIQNGTLTKDPTVTTSFRIIQVASGANLTIKNLRLSNGSMTGVSDLAGALLVSGGGRLALVSNATFDNNSATNGGAIAYGDAGGASSGSAIVQDSLFFNNVASSNGGAIIVFGSTLTTIERTNFISNTARSSGVLTAFGGAIAVLTGSITTIDASYFLENRAITSGTGGTFGAAISVRGLTTSASIGTLQNSTFESNRATQRGGAIHLQGGNSANPASITKLINSTFSGNSVTTATSDGGAISVDSDSFITGIFNTTIASNTAVAAGGGIHFTTAPASPRNVIAALRSTIVARNTAAGGPNIWEAASGNIVLASESFNLIGDNSGSNIVAGTPNANSSYVGTSGALVNPLLDPLRDNGGLVPTRALNGGSPAIDRGANLATPSLVYDQRSTGFLRTRGAQTDIGAFEVQACSLDRDGDGICDDVDTCPLVPNLFRKCFVDKNQGD